MTGHVCPPDHAHGATSECYLRHGCRDQDCKDGQARRARERRREIAYGTYTRARVDAEPVRQHLVWLRSNGMGIKYISRACGVPDETLAGIMWGRRDRHTGEIVPVRQVSQTSADKVLAVQPELQHLAAGARIDATGIRRRVQALVAHGWSLSAIARHDGTVSVHNLRAWAHADTITAGNARDVVALFDALCLTLPPASTPQERAMAVRARRMAGRHRWLPALAWDDIDTDEHPYQAKPDDETAATQDEDIDEIAVELALAGRGVRLTPGERRVCVRVLHAKRWSDGAIAAQLRCVDKTVGRIRDELHLPAWPLEELEVQVAA